MESMQNPGATRFDTMCHEIYSGKNNGQDYFSVPANVRCGNCGRPLEVYYCESRLYLVECRHCEIKALVKASNPVEAAYKTFGHAVYPIEDMGEKDAVFFARVPIDESPVYVGSVIDCDFPKGDVVCGMYLPCPGTDGVKAEEK